METKYEKFKRLAENRTNKIIEMIRLLGNLSVKSTYEYSEKDISKIFSAIEKELRNTKSKFSELADDNKKFKL